MPNTRSKKNRRKRRIAELDLQPGAVYHSLFTCIRYVIQTSYNDTVWLYYEYQNYRRFERLSVNEFYDKIGFVGFIKKNDNILNFPQPKKLAG